MMLPLQQISLLGKNYIIKPRYILSAHFLFLTKICSLPGTSEADAERRRKKALAVLSKRLQSVETQEEAWSDDDEPASQKGNPLVK